MDMVNLKAKVISSNNEDYGDNTPKGQTVKDIVLKTHSIFDEWLNDCQFTMVTGLRYDVRRVGNGVRFVSDQYVYNVTIREAGALFKKSEVMVLITREAE